MSRGFTLLEVMISMAVMVTGVLAMAPLLNLSIHRGTHARQLSTAQHLAEEVLERLRLEIRYDANPPAGASLAEADAWKYDVLPHAPNAASAGAGCQPTGHDDGFAYDYGPFVFRRANHDFTLCYSLTPINTMVPRHAQLPPASMETRVRVLWRDARTGWATWSMSDLLVSGF